MTVQKKRNLAHNAIIGTLLLLLVSVLPVTYRAVARGQQIGPASAPAVVVITPDVKAAKMPLVMQIAKAAPAIQITKAKQAPASQPASAPAAIKGPDDASGLWGTLRTALKGKDWSLAVAAAFALFVLSLRLGAGKLRGWLPVAWAKGKLDRFLGWCATDRGGAVLVLFSGVLAGVVNARAAGQALSVDLIFNSINVAAASATSGAGLYVLIKKLAWPSDKPKIASTPV